LQKFYYFTHASPSLSNRAEGGDDGLKRLKKGG
jgi:hypothetical protein